MHTLYQPTACRCVSGRPDLPKTTLLLHLPHPRHPNPKQLVITYGGWGTSAGRPGQACNKRSPPCMGVGLLRKLSVHFLCVVVPEHHTTKTCYHCGGKMIRHTEHEEARRPVRDEAAAAKLAAALEKAGDDEVARARAQRRHDCCVRCRPHIRDLRVCIECGIVSNRDRNGAANIGLNGKRFARRSADGGDEEARRRGGTSGGDGGRGDEAGLR